MTAEGKVLWDIASNSGETEGLMKAIELCNAKASRLADAVGRDSAVGAKALAELSVELVALVREKLKARAG